MMNEKLLQRLRSFNRARNWEQFHTPKNLAMALAAEAGELLAEFQWLTGDESKSAVNRGPLRKRVEDEIADVTIYLVELADVLAIDLDEVVLAKMERNEARFTETAKESWLESVEALDTSTRGDA